MQQLADGIYVKTLTPVEAKLYERIKTEEKERIEFSYHLQAQHNKLTQAMDAISASIGNINTTLNGILGSIGAIEERLAILESSGSANPDNYYTRAEVNAMLAAYYVEEISHQYEWPKGEFFDATPLDKKLTGYRHFPWARLKGAPDITFNPDTMRRYSVSVYASTARQLVFPVTHEDYMVIYHNDREVALLSGNNVGSRADLVTIYLDHGWNILQFLMASKNTSYTFDIGLDLAREVDAVACLNINQLVVGSENIGTGAVLPEHINTGGKYTFFNGQFTRTDSPAVVCGDNSQGSIKVGSGILEYSNNKLTLNCGLKVEGPLEWSGVNEDKPGTAYLWPVVDIYLPPGMPADDAGAYRGKAVYVPTGTVSNVISCPDTDTQIYPGPYRLYIRLRPETPISGMVGVVNVMADNSLIASLDIDGSMFGADGYATARLNFNYKSGALAIEFRPAGTIGVYLDYVYIVLGT